MASSSQTPSGQTEGTKRYGVNPLSLENRQALRLGRSSGVVAGTNIPALRRAVTATSYKVVIISPAGEVILTGNPKGPNLPPKELVETLGKLAATALVNPVVVEEEQKPIPPKGKGPAKSVKEQAVNQLSNIGYLETRKTPGIEKLIVFKKQLGEVETLHPIEQAALLQAVSVAFVEFKTEFTKSHSKDAWKTLSESFPSREVASATS
jgi:hypothetical protein